MRPPKITQEVDGFEFVYFEMWRVANRHFVYGENNKIGSYLDFLSAMFFSYCALEGYVNFLGDAIDTKTWDREKEHFKNGGLKDKIFRLRFILNIGEADFGRSPYATLVSLKKLRDAVAHSKVRRRKIERKRSNISYGVHFEPTFLEEFVSHQKARTGISDVLAVAEELHEAARLKFPGKIINHKPFDGIYSLHSISVDPSV